MANKYKTRRSVQHDRQENGLSWLLYLQLEFGCRGNRQRDNWLLIHHSCLLFVLRLVVCCRVFRGKSWRIGELLLFKEKYKAKSLESKERSRMNKYGLMVKWERE